MDIITFNGFSGTDINSGYRSQTLNKDIKEAARYISPEYQEEVEALIEDLGLEFMGADSTRI